MVNHGHQYQPQLGTSAHWAVFGSPTSATEIHVILQVEAQGENFGGQLWRLTQAEQEMMSLPEFKGAQPVFKRFFLSDAANQAQLISTDDSCSFSLIQQQPLNGSKIGLWIYLQQGTDIYRENDITIVNHNGYQHLWQFNMTEEEGDSYTQTARLLIRYETDLLRHDATLADNCIRTWFYVRDVDTQYAGLVRARRENFEKQGLTSHTHFIASTGIGGIPASPRALVQLGGYALKGFAPEQLHYLYAPSHLNPTYEYGVTFERGAYIDFGDRRHIYISGTASIDHLGQVVHEGDIVKQTHRMWENVEALLNEGGAQYSDVMQIIVYLRDVGDYQRVNAMFRQKFPDTPFIITLAPVCRPAWLIEMECIAITPASNPQFRDF